MNLSPTCAANMALKIQESIKLLKSISSKFTKSGWPRICVSIDKKEWILASIDDETRDILIAIEQWLQDNDIT